MAFIRDKSYMRTSEEDYLQVQETLDSKEGVTQLRSRHELIEWSLYYDGCAVLISHKLGLGMTNIAVASKDRETGSTLFNELEGILEQARDGRKV
jgi:hypothetical protein